MLSLDEQVFFFNLFWISILEFSSVTAAFFFITFKWHLEQSQASEGWDIYIKHVLSLVFLKLFSNLPYLYLINSLSSLK